MNSIKITTIKFNSIYHYTSEPETQWFIHARCPAQSASMSQPPAQSPSDPPLAPPPPPPVFLPVVCLYCWFEPPFAFPPQSRYVLAQCQLCDSYLCAVHYQRHLVVGNPDECVVVRQAREAAELREAHQAPASAPQ